MAYEVVTPTVRLVVCGSGPDAVPVARLAAGLGWSVTVVDHRPVELARPERFPGVRVVECADAGGLASVVALTARSAVVVMSHHYGRDLDYLDALLDRELAYVGLLGPRSRTERMLADLGARGRRVSEEARGRLHAHPRREPTAPSMRYMAASHAQQQQQHAPPPQRPPLLSGEVFGVRVPIALGAAFLIALAMVVLVWFIVS